MAEEKILKDEIMSEEQLDQVAGGTVGEFEDILVAFAKQGVFKKTNAASAHIPVINQGIAEGVEALLGEIGIKADIDLGYGGTGVGSGKNTYTDANSGHPISHAEVLKRIESAVGRAYKTVGL